MVNNPARMDDYCRERGFSGWFETSAKENINIDEASRFLVNRVSFTAFLTNSDINSSFDMHFMTLLYFLSLLSMFSKV